MAYQNPQVTDFKTYFNRDFRYGGVDGDPNDFVLDLDINKGFMYTSIALNPELFPNQGAYTMGYLLLSAHQMVLNLRASSQGINGQYNWAQNQKAVGAVSESFTIPQQIQDNPLLMMLTKTNYGADYLMLILPYLIGPVFTVHGRTKP